MHSISNIHNNVSIVQLLDLLIFKKTNECVIWIKSDNFIIFYDDYISHPNWYIPYGIPVFIYVPKKDDSLCDLIWNPVRDTIYEIRYGTPRLVFKNAIFCKTSKQNQRIQLLKKNSGNIAQNAFPFQTK